MGNSFYEFTLIMNKLNKLFLENINIELSKNKIRDVNPIQALLMKNIESGHIHICNATDRGYHLGTNISYNVKDLVKKGYMDRIEDKNDLRSAYLVLTKKGREVVDILDRDNMSKQELLQKLKIDVNNVNAILLKLKRIF